MAKRKSKQIKSTRAPNTANTTAHPADTPKLNPYKSEQNKPVLPTNDVPKEKCGEILSEYGNTKNKIRKLYALDKSAKEWMSYVRESLPRDDWQEATLKILLAIEDVKAEFEDHLDDEPDEQGFLYASEFYVLLDHFILSDYKHNPTHAAQDWDIMRLIPVLMSSPVRVTSVGTTKTNDRHMQYKHIDATWLRTDPKRETLKFDMKYYDKKRKGLYNTAFFARVCSSATIDQILQDPILFFVVGAISDGMIKNVETVEDFFGPEGRNQAKFEWKYPERPVFRSYNRDGTPSMHPASAGELQWHFLRMALAADLLTKDDLWRIGLHGFGCGAGKSVDKLFGAVASARVLNHCQTLNYTHYCNKFRDIPISSLTVDLVGDPGIQEKFKELKSLLINSPSVGRQPQMANKVTTTELDAQDRTVEKDLHGDLVGGADQEQGATADAKGFHIDILRRYFPSLDIVQVIPQAGLLRSMLPPSEPSEKDKPQDEFSADLKRRKRTKDSLGDCLGTATFVEARTSIAQWLLNLLHSKVQPRFRRIEIGPDAKEESGVELRVMVNNVPPWDRVYDQARTGISPAEMHPEERWITLDEAMAEGYCGFEIYPRIFVPGSQPLFRVHALR